MDLKSSASSPLLAVMTSLILLEFYLRKRIYFESFPLGSSCAITGVPFGNTET